jgi:uncharacterized protein YwqG
MTRETPWPKWQGVPQSFLAEIYLDDLRRAGGPGWLPDGGRLLFFYDSEQSTWGLSPADRGSWIVIHDVSAPSTAPRVRPPEGGIEFPELPITLTAADSLPTPERLGLHDPDFPEEEWERFSSEAEARLPIWPVHQIGGWPYPIQNDTMELECQLTTHGYDCGDPDVYRSKAAEELRENAPDWKLLLQLDSDDATGMQWGDAGLLYFWVRESDARDADFSKVWLILQCS